MSYSPLLQAFVGAKARVGRMNCGFIFARATTIVKEGFRAQARAGAGPLGTIGAYLA